MLALRAAGVSHAFGDHRVLADISVQVRRGEWLAIVGPSGSGKSTLLSILGLLLVPDAGTVHVGGRGDVLGLRRRARLAVMRDIGWVFQASNAQPRRQVLDNVAGPLILRGRGHSGARQAAQEILDRLGIGHLADMPARALSGGELQRVSIARAVVAQPTIVIADEPTGQLDASTTDEALSTLRRVSQFGTGVLVATHDLAVADRADRVLPLRDGRLQP